MENSNNNSQSDYSNDENENQTNGIIMKLDKEKIKLSLKLDKTSFFRSESITLLVSILNDSSYRIRIEDLSISNNSLFFFAINEQREKFSGSIQTPDIKDGLPINPIEEKILVTLEPKGRQSTKIELLDVLGELPEGQYQAKGTYLTGLVFIESQPISFKILKSKPVYSITERDYMRTEISPTRTAWVNEEKNGLHLFVMATSQYKPSNLRSNRRIMKIDKIQKFYPSILARPDLEIEHLLWIEERKVKIAVVINKGLKEVRSIKLPISNPIILEPPLSNYEGRLLFVVASKKNNASQFYQVSHSFAGKTTIEEICTFNGDFTKYCVIYDEDLMLHVAWATEVGKIFYTAFDSEKSKMARGLPRIIAEGKPPILDLQLSKSLMDENGNLQLLLNFVDYKSPIDLHSKLINVETMREHSQSFHYLPELEYLTLLDTVLDLECKPHFLFHDKEGALWFKSFEDAKPARVTEKDEIYPNTVTYPTLIVSSNQSRNYGIYLRVIKNNTKFVYKQLISFFGI
jgi:hypothetical protein